MTTLVLETEPIAVHVTVTEDKLTVDLADGRSLVVPLAWYPRLVQGSPAERQHWQLLGDGYAIEWPDLDEHIGLEGLLAGRQSGESEGRKWSERVYGGFHRSIELPTEVQNDKVTAAFKNGVLTITVPKAEASKVRSIPVTSA